MNLSSPAPPTVYNPFQLTHDQQDINTQTAIQNQAGSNVNQVTPFGTLTYKQTGVGPGGVPLYTATTELSPAQQQLLDQLMGTKSAAGQQASRLIAGADYGGRNPADVIGGMTSGATKDWLDKQMGYLNPTFDRDISNLDAKLRNQGLAPGTPAYDQAMNALKQSQGQTVSGALAAFEPQAFSQAIQSYGLPLATAKQLLGISSPTGPSFVNTPGLSGQPANAIAAAANAQQADAARYAAQMQQQNAMLSGIFGVPTAVLGGWARAGLPGAGNLFGVVDPFPK